MSRAGKAAGQAEPLPHQVFWRLHWLSSPAFSARNAWSVMWGGWDDRAETVERGYSCMDTACGLQYYFDEHWPPFRGPAVETARLVVFGGGTVGEGNDGEPLVVPDRVLAWLSPAHLPRLCRVETDEGDKAALRLAMSLPQVPPPAARAPAGGWARPPATGSRVRPARGSRAR